MTILNAARHRTRTRCSAECGSDSLTEGYKSKIPLFHNVFHVCVEICSHHRVSPITKMNKKAAHVGGFRNKLLKITA
jgi:hypothetical protein